MPLLLYCLLLMLLYFIYPAELLTLGKESLILWYNSILPGLFPSMVIAGILLPYMAAFSVSEKKGARFLRRFARLFGISEKGLLAVIPGFLCGFPMGSYLSRKLLDEQVISRQEAQRILAFSNNIGPIYFLTVIAAEYEVSLKVSALLLFYSIPLLYALSSSLVHTLTGTICEKRGAQSSRRHGHSGATDDSPGKSFHPVQRSKRQSEIAINSKTQTKQQTRLQTIPQIKTGHKEQAELSPLLLLDESIGQAVRSVLRLCGYIFAARTLLIFPTVLSAYLPGLDKTGILLCNALIEVASGMEQMSQLPLPGNKLILLEIPFLVFGGLCSIAQTACMIRGSSLSLPIYIRHKCIQGILAFLLCFVFTLLG